MTAGPSPGASGTALGANVPAPARVLAALGLPSEGRVIELAQILDSTAVTERPRLFHQVLLAHGLLDRDDTTSTEGRATFFDEIVTQSYHMGCHVDALAHVGVDGVFHGGAASEEIYSPLGLRRLGIEASRPWIARGLCLDLTAVVGPDRLGGGAVIGTDQLEAACERQGVAVEEGDAVLVNTGWGALWHADPERYASAAPGVGIEATRWLVERSPVLVGADTWSFEPMPVEDPSRPLRVHQLLLAENGIQIVENAKLDELVEATAGPFLFLAAANRVRGASASMIAPVAVL